MIFFDKGRQIYEEFYITFSNLRYKKKKFYEFLTKLKFVKFCDSYVFCQNINLNVYKKKIVTMYF